MNQKIQELETLVRFHNEKYHNGTPIVTDAEFDEIVEELRALDPASPALAEVGALPEYGRKVKHPSIMGSLEKVTSGGEILSWFKGNNFDCSMIYSPKVDGCAVRLRYAGGQLVEAATRGDGEVGQDVLLNVLQIDDILKQLPEPIDLEVRGEVYMKKSVCKELGVFANPRNGAAGSLLQKDPDRTGDAKLSFFAYGAKGIALDEKRMLGILGGMGFPVVDSDIVDLPHLEALLLDWKNKRDQLDYCIDGLVFSACHFAEQERVGWNGKRPKGKTAWKFPPEQREAAVLGVEWQVGRTGKLTPVLNITPTTIDGSTVSNVSLHSVALFDNLALCVDDKVLVEKAGDIIPQVARVSWRATTGSKLKCPDTCPSCGSKPEVEGAHLYCRNPLCAAQCERRILFWLQELGVKGAGPSVVAGLCTGGLVKVPSDLYFCEAGSIGKAIGSKTIGDKIENELANKANVPAWKFLAALGISGLGHTTGKVVAKYCGSIDKMLSCSSDEFVRLEGIGSTTATQIVAGLQVMRDEIMKLGAVLDIEFPAAGGKLTGMSFCLTGAMSKPRAQIEKMIEEAGGSAKSSVGSGLTFLVTNDTASGSAKNLKAQKLGIKIINEAELMAMFTA
jgi:DNA ligase (NAD+)